MLWLLKFLRINEQRAYRLRTTSLATPLTVKLEALHAATIQNYQIALKERRAALIAVAVTGQIDVEERMRESHVA